MKKLHIALLVASFVIPNISFASIDTNLKYGSRGVVVTELQDFLIAKGFLTGQTSGNFFSLTRKAVVAYQTSVGLPATGYVGPMTRTKINDDLSATNAPAISAEITEMGTTTAQTNTSAQKSAAASSLVSGCSSTAGFSPATGKSCSDAETTATSTTTNKTFTLPNGTVIEVDANGNIVRTITPAPVVPSMQPSAQTQISSAENIPALSISLGEVTTTTNSAHLSWNTNIPTDSKVFLTLSDGSIQVIPSASGYSTQHFVNIPNTTNAMSLSPNTQYSYTIEVTNNALAKKLTGFINTKAQEVVIAPIDPCLTIAPTNITVTPWTLQNSNNYVDIHSAAPVVIPNSSASDLGSRGNFETYVAWKSAQPLFSDRVYLKVDVVAEKNCLWSVRKAPGYATSYTIGQSGDYFGINFYDMPTSGSLDWSPVENLGVINQGDINFTIVGKSGSYSTSTPVIVKLRIQ